MAGHDNRVGRSPEVGGMIVRRGVAPATLGRWLLLAAGDYRRMRRVRSASDGTPLATAKRARRRQGPAA